MVLKDIAMFHNRHRRQPLFKCCNDFNRMKMPMSMPTHQPEMKEKHAATICEPMIDTMTDRFDFFSEFLIFLFEILDYRNRDTIGINRFRVRRQPPMNSIIAEWRISRFKSSETMKMHCRTSTNSISSRVLCLIVRNSTLTNRKLITVSMFLSINRFFSPNTITKCRFYRCITSSISIIFKCFGLFAKLWTTDLDWFAFFKKRNNIDSLWRRHDAYVSRYCSTWIRQLYFDLVGEQQQKRRCLFRRTEILGQNLRGTRIEMLKTTKQLIKVLTTAHIIRFWWNVTFYVTLRSSIWTKVFFS